MGQSYFLFSLSLLKQQKLVVVPMVVPTHVKQVVRENVKGIADMVVKTPVVELVLVVLKNNNKLSIQIIKPL